MAKKAKGRKKTSQARKPARKATKSAKRTSAKTPASLLAPVRGAQHRYIGTLQPWLEARITTVLPAARTPEIDANSAG